MSKIRCRGFTLIEVLVVVAALGIAMAAGGPAFVRLLNKVQVDGAAKCSALLMRQARLRAIQRSVIATIRLEGRKLVADADRRLPRECTLPDEIDTWSVSGFLNTDRPEPAGVAIFQTDGSAAETGSFRFDDFRGNSVRVDLDPAAVGRVRVLKLEGGAWHARDEGGRPWIWL